MESNWNQMLQMMERPAFFVCNGIITQANQAARSQMIPVGEPIAPLLCTGKTEYESFDGGWIYLTLQLGSRSMEASVQRLEACDLFVLEPDNTMAQYRTLALAAQQLRNPLGRILAMTDRLFPNLELEEGSTASEQVARINRGLHQMLRLVCNMSDAARYASNPPSLETRDLNAVLEELFEQAMPLCEAVGITLTYTGTPAPVYTLVDSEQMERCVYNILSNAMQHMPAGGEIAATLTRRGKTLLLCVTDNGTGIQLEQMGDIFTQFLRAPSLSNPDQGLGLGMSLIRSCAKTHGGTVLLTTGEQGGLKLTVTMQVRLDDVQLASPRTRIDYAGERSHGLIELSECLPHTLYQVKKR